jgi:hypothetical protein
MITISASGEGFLACCSNSTRNLASRWAISSACLVSCYWKDKKILEYSCARIEYNFTCNFICFANKFSFLLDKSKLDVELLTNLFNIEFY